MAAKIYKDLFGHHDTLENTTATERNSEHLVTTLTPYQRLVKVFTRDEFGEPSNEVQSIMQVAGMSLFIGTLYGGVLSSRDAYQDFFRRNQATAFANHLEAKRRLQDQVTIAFGKGAWKWAWRLTLFSTSYITFTTAVAVYRGKNGILEHVVAGGAAGSLYKFYQGPRATLVGGVLGMALGLMGGSLSLLMLRVSGLEMSEVMKNSERWRRVRIGSVEAGLKESQLSGEKEIVRSHAKQPHETTLENVGNSM